MKKGFHRSTLILFMLGTWIYIQTSNLQCNYSIKLYYQISAISRFKFVETILFTFDTKRNTGNEFQSSLASRWDADCESFFRNSICLTYVISYFYATKI